MKPFPDLPIFSFNNYICVCVRARGFYVWYNFSFLSNVPVIFSKVLSTSDNF